MATDWPRFGPHPSGNVVKKKHFFLNFPPKKIECPRATPSSPVSVATTLFLFFVFRFFFLVPFVAFVVLLLVSSFFGRPFPFSVEKQN